MENLTIGTWVIAIILMMLAGTLLFSLLYSGAEIKHIKKSPRFFAIAFIFFLPITAACYISLGVFMVIVGSIITVIDVFKKQ